MRVKTRQYQATRLAGNSFSEMTYSVSSGT